VSDHPKYKFDDLVAIVGRLRGENGCPWDNQQTLESVRKYFLEEAYEALDAIDRGDMKALCEELGDTLWEILFLARIAEQNGAFTTQEMVQLLGEKMVRRHPHIFGEDVALDVDAVVAKWADIKKSEGKANSHYDVLARVPRSLPALLRAQRVGERVAKVGYDWDDVPAVLEKVKEEFGEFLAEIKKGNKENIEGELGDMFFALAQAARHLNLSAEDALRSATDKFVNRFGAVEKILEVKGEKLEGKTPEELDELWNFAKAVERAGKDDNSGNGQ